VELQSGLHVGAVSARILQVCHVVFFKQLSCWLLHGSLNDEHNEFFIARTLQSASLSTEADLSANDEFDVDAVTGNQLNRILASTATLLIIVFTISRLFISMVVKMQR